jgi:hypothetical protein
VTHRASSRFWRSYRALPKDVRQLADRCFAVLKADPGHPSLHFKKIRQFWSVRVGLHYRALGVEADDDLLWFWVGSHAEYDRLVERQPANKPLQPTSRIRSKDKGTKKGRATRG